MKRIFLSFKKIATTFLCLFISMANAQNPQVDFPSGKEEENLNVFHKWLRWNNPGGLFINDLVRQASGKYDERDVQISKLYTVGDWIERQDWVRNKLEKSSGLSRKSHR